MAFYSPDSLVAVDSAATPDFIGIASNDGVLRTSSPLTYSDGGDFVTLGIDQSAIDHGSIGGLADDDHSQYHNDSRALTWLGTRSTTDLSEGTNLYFTDERVDDRVATLLQNGGGLTWTYSDVGNTLTPDIDHDTTTNFVANEHIDHTAVTLTAGTGLTGGGDISANRTFDVSGLTTSETAAGSKTGLDVKFVTGTAGTSGNVVTWNADGDAVDGGSSIADLQQTDEEVQDLVGAMFSGNTETLITATYQDADGTIDLVVDNDLANYDNTNSGFITATLTQEEVEDYAGSLISNATGTHTGISITYQDATGDMDFIVDHDTATNFVANEHINHTSVTLTAGTGLSGGGDISANRTFNVSADYSVISGNDASTNVTSAELETLTDGSDADTLHTHGAMQTDEEVQDLVGAMFSGNTETLITATYQDADGTIDLVVNEASIDHDNLTGFVANEHIDWTGASAGTIDATNIEDKFLRNDGNDSTSGSLTASNFYVSDGGTIGISGADLWTFDSTNGDITTTSNVGIGTTTPDYLVDVVGTTDGKMKLENTGNSNTNFFFKAARTSQGTDIGAFDGIWSGTDTVARVAFSTGSDTVNKDDGRIDFWTQPSGGALSLRTRIDTDGAMLIAGTTQSNADTTFLADGGAVFNEQGNDTDFRVEGVGEPNALFVQGSDGNVGIGTASPGQELVVASSDIGTQISLQNEKTASAVNFQDILFRQKDSGGTVGNFAMIRQDPTDVTAGSEDGQLQFQVMDGGSIASRLTIDGSNVGIGTTSPDGKLHVAGDVIVGNGGDKLFINEYSAGISYITAGASDNNKEQHLWFQPRNSGGGIFNLLKLDGSGEVYIDGNVGIGTTSPTSPSSVDTFLEIESATHAGIVLHDSGGSPNEAIDIYTKDGELLHRINGSLKMVLDNSGNVGIGTASPGAILDAKGEIRATDSFDNTIFQINPNTPYFSFQDAGGSSKFYMGGSEIKSINFYPFIDDTYYLGKNSTTVPFAWKGICVKDTSNGNYYRIEVTNGSVTATQIT